MWDLRTSKVLNLGRKGEPHRAGASRDNTEAGPEDVPNVLALG